MCQIWQHLKKEPEVACQLFDISCECLFTKRSKKRILLGIRIWNATEVAMMNQNRKVKLEGKNYMNINKYLNN